MNASIYVSRDGKQFGPYDEDTLKHYVNNGNVGLSDPAWYQGLPDWQPVHQILGVPPPPPKPSHVARAAGRPVAVHGAGRFLKITGALFMVVGVFMAAGGVAGAFGALLLILGFFIFVAGRFMD